MTDLYFDDPDHRASEAEAFVAERAERAGAVDDARAAFRDAARLEERAARRVVPADDGRMRSLFAISAVALWLRAAEWDEAARAGCAFLGEPDALTPDGRRALRSLIERALT